MGDDLKARLRAIVTGGGYDAAGASAMALAEIERLKTRAVWVSVNAEREDIAGGAWRNEKAPAFDTPAYLVHRDPEEPQVGEVWRYNADGGSREQNVEILDPPFDHSRGRQVNTNIGLCYTRTLTPIPPTRLYRIAPSELTPEQVAELEAMGLAVEEVER